MTLFVKTMFDCIPPESLQPFSSGSGFPPQVQFSGMHVWFSLIAVACRNIALACAAGVLSTIVALLLLNGKVF